MKIARKFAQAVPLALVSLVASTAMATQTVTPYTAATGGAAIAAATVPAGTVFTFFGRYEVLAGSTGNESGLGLKVKYDKTKFSTVTVDQVYTKCMIAAPDQQESVPATSQVVFGWIDTSIRRTASVPNGVVGWPATADPAAPGAADGCLNPGGIVVDQAGVAPPLSLFRVQMQTLPGFTSGTTTVNLTSDGNYSYAGTTPGFTDKSIVLTGAAAPTIALTSVVSRKTHGAAGTFDVPLPNYATAITGAIDVEPRQIGAQGHQIVFQFNSPPTSAGTVSIQNSLGASIAGATSVTSFSGNEMTVTLSNIPNNQRVALTVPGVNGVLSVAANVGFLVGDVSGNRIVNSTDVGTVKGQSGVAVSGSNFKSDLSANGTINATDVGVVKGASGTSLN